MSRGPLAAQDKNCFSASTSLFLSTTACSSETHLCMAQFSNPRKDTFYFVKGELYIDKTLETQSLHLSNYIDMFYK